MTHVHHWRIDTPDGPESAGTCECGAMRQFQNVFTGDRTHAFGGVQRGAPGYERRAVEQRIRSVSRATADDWRWEFRR